jgi:hypothetical protein
MRYLVLLIMGCFLFSVVNGQNNKGFHFQITHDNDFLAPGNKDYNYTGGLKVELQTPGFLYRYQPIFPRFKKGSDSVLNIQKFSFGGTAYTPLDLKYSNVQYGDRPYASFVFFSLGRQSFSANNRKTISSELFLGSMGKDGPGNIQSHLHETNFMGSTRDVPQGWDNQIAYPGGFVFNYNLRYRELLFHSNQLKARQLIKRKATSRLKFKDEQLLNKFLFGELDSTKVLERNLHSVKKFEWVQLQWHGGVDIGLYMMNAQTGIALYLFNFNSSPFLNNNPGLPTFLSEDGAKQKRCLRFNLFLEPNIRYAAFNSTLEGMLFNDKSIYTISSNQVKRILFEMNGGLNVLLGDVVYLRYNMAIRSQEFVTGKRWHKWGAVTVGVSMPAWHRRSF